jgi:hypothetical protein
MKLLKMTYNNIGHFQFKYCRFNYYYIIKLIIHLEGSLFIDPSNYL